MNDKIIIKAISKIHSAIVNFLSFIFLLFFLTFIVLQNGIYLENISLPNVEIKQLYIKWNEKINISIKETEIVHKTNNSPIDFEEINKVLQQIPIFNNWFESIIIDKLVFNNITASFSYKEGKNGFFTASSPDFSLKSSLFFESNLLNLQIDEFIDLKRKITTSGNIIVDNENLELATSLNVNINNDISLNVLTLANKDKLFYKVNSLKNIKNINYTMKLLDLHPDVKYWAYEAIEMSHATIESAFGWLEYKNLDTAYKNISVSATGHNLSYKYNPNLDAVHSKTTELKFKDGVLSIYPKQAYSYDNALDKSWLKIDFTPKEEVLTLHLLFDAKLDKNILNILSSYKINVPFLQNSGTTKTNLKLTVNLRTIGVEANGDFFTKKANFDYLGLKIDVSDVSVLLNNYDVKINNMLAQYKDIATTKVNVSYDAHKGEGKINFDVKNIAFKDFNISLNNKEPLKVIYSIAPKQDTIDVANSTWFYKDKVINIDKMSLPFSLAELIIHMPRTLVNVPNIASVYVSGVSELKTDKVNLNLDFASFSYEGIKLSQPISSINLLYDKKITLSANNKIGFTFNSLACGLDKPTIDIDNNNFTLKSSSVNIDDFAKAKLTGNYDFKENKGLVALEELNISNKERGEMFASDEKINLDIVKSDRNIKVNIPKLDTSYTQSNEKMSLDIKSIDKLAQNSKILQDFNITTGNFNLNKNFSDNHTKFVANIKHPYKLLVKENEPVEDYSIEGKINNTTKKTSLNINNDALKITIDKDIRIRMKDTGVNVDSLINFIHNQPDSNNSSTSESSESSKSKNVIMNAKNSYLYISKDRHVLSDTLYLEYHDKITAAHFTHAKGNAKIDIQNGELHVYGENFNDIFMQNLFVLSKFKGGSFDFSVDGTTEEYDGLFYIKDTIVLDYKILNNVLAFVNTIPSLVTFSLPGYSSNGLNVSSAYMHFNSKDNLFTISDIYLDSKEIDILGKGTANLNTNNINLLLNLKTDLASSILNIPVVSYILFDGKTLSTTVNVTGALDNPDVKSLIAEDIVVAPLNIIKRALFLPYHLISNDEEKEE
ncbi:MAG: AsmA-like C-terminal domain-containing protein [Sulfurimonas sp.]|jgi:hypothetical protein